MDVFEITVKLKVSDLKLFIVPFEIHDSGVAGVGYLLVVNNDALGSMYISEDFRWISKDPLPWDDEDLQKIGKQIELQYFLSV